MPGGKMWYDLQTQAGLPESQKLLKDWLSTLPETTGIPLEKTILAGFSQGGAMTLDLGLQFPLEGLIVFSGYLHAPIVPKFHPPTLVVHGQQDPVVPLAAAQQVRQQLIAAGVAVTYQEFVMGHEIRPEVVQLSRTFIQALENVRA
jgi:phospholipase/carboxylesterase